jgi:signal peptidase I
MNPEMSEQIEQTHSGWHTLFDWVKTIAIALLIAIPIRYFIAEPFIVSGASMDPTFASGNFLIVDRVSYRFNEPKRDDVIVFKYPNNPSVYYIKRIIGLPGETVKIDDGKVVIVNDENPTGIKLKEPFVAKDHKSYDSSITVLGENEYFVMGDNREQSSDSRTWGPLDKNLIIGRPVLRLLPMLGISVWPGEYKSQ